MSGYPTPELRPDPAYSFAAPAAPRPIVVVGAGGIVRDAHLPAYRRYGYPVAALVDPNLPRARALADEYGVERCYADITEAVADAPADTVYDLAVMPEHHREVLSKLPDGAPVLLQKPLGHDLTAGRALVELCHQKRLVAAVNTQLRFAPYVEQARTLIGSGSIGELVDLEVVVTVRTPWEMFPATLGLNRLELNMHSVHYLDLIRSFLGDPTGVAAMTLRHPARSYANSRSTILLRFGERPVRVVISTNHEHDFGPTYEQSFVKFEGVDGAVRFQMGLLMDYPRGREDTLEWITHRNLDAGWQPLAFEGSWFPDAFARSMGALQRYLSGEIATLPHSVDDVLKTMALVDAGHVSSDQGGISPDYTPVS